MEANMQMEEIEKSAVAEIKSAFIKVREQTDKICKPLLLEDYSAQPITDVSPPKWHLGHTTWFFENFVLKPAKKNYTVFNADFNYLFNSYYESIGARLQRADRGVITRPPTVKIYDYRNYVNEKMLEFLESEKEISKKTINIIALGIQHEQQHQELLLTDIKYILGINPLFPAFIRGNKTTLEYPADHPSDNYLDIPGGLYKIGADADDAGFDNEKEKHVVFLNAFRFLERLVTNQEYLEFINDNGYENFRFWLQEGWEWIKLNKIKAPLYWHYVNDEWYAFSLRGLNKLSPFEPVTHISYYEADAFAKWRNKRLLTEFEWETAAKILYKQIPENANFLEDGHYNPLHRLNCSSQLFGDAWEWTSSAYLPYPGFKTAEGALGEYNGKFMINQMVLRGGSCATPRNFMRHSCRNFFHPDKRWQFTGIRLAETVK